MSAEQPPSWLVAWRESQGQPQVPARPEPRPRPARRRPPPVGTAQRGFTEPRPWAFDGGARREAVLDTDYMPPRVVRRVGWADCLRCRRPFFSHDVVGQRLCGECRADADRYA